MSCLNPIPSTNPTSQTKFLTVSSMLSAYRAFLLPLTLRQLIFWYSRYILPWNLPPVAVIAEMRIAPTKPLCYCAAKSAFEGNKLFSVLFAIVDLDRAAGRTDEFFGIELFVLAAFAHGVCAIFATSKVRLVAFVTLEVRIDGLCIFNGLIVILRMWVHYLLIFRQSLMIESFKCLFLYILL